MIPSRADSSAGLPNPTRPAACPNNCGRADAVRMLAFPDEGHGRLAQTTQQFQSHPRIVPIPAGDARHGGEGDRVVAATIAQGPRRRLQSNTDRRIVGHLARIDVAICCFGSARSTTAAARRACSRSPG